ncbi:unnamed protein product, partial [Hapterophycus canaliculatus]
RDLEVALLLNIARAYSARSDYATSTKACSAALAVNPSSAKGLYLRGKALIAPASAGAFEVEEAMRDVSRAGELAPGDTLIRAFMNKLRTERSKQKETDRATFAGMFDRGSVCNPEASPKSRDLRAPTHGDGNAERGVHCRMEEDCGDDAAGIGSGDKAGRMSEQGNGSAGITSSMAAGMSPIETRRHVEDRLAFLNGMARKCEEEGRQEWADCYRQRLASIENTFSGYAMEKQDPPARVRGSRTKMDWKNPSEAMIKRAAKDECDLNNPAVISFLVKMQEEHEKIVDGEEDKSQDGEDYCNQESWTEEIWEGAILCMNRKEVTALLKGDLGIDQVPADATLGELRNLATRKV